MLRFLKSFFGKSTPPEPEVPYKVETPVVTPIMIPPAPEPVKCGCGRSASGFCVGLHKLTQEEWAVHPDNPKKVTPPVSKNPAKPAPAKKKPAAMTASKKSSSKSSKPTSEAPKPRRPKSVK